jgi:hypothetical protein
MRCLPTAVTSLRDWCASLPGNGWSLLMHLSVHDASSRPICRRQCVQVAAAVSAAASGRVRGREQACADLDLDGAVAAGGADGLLDPSAGAVFDSAADRESPWLNHAEFVALGSASISPRPEGGSPRDANRRRPQAQRRDATGSSPGLGAIGGPIISTGPLPDADRRTTASSSCTTTGHPVAAA